MWYMHAMGPLQLTSNTETHLVLLLRSIILLTWSRSTTASLMLVYFAGTRRISTTPCEETSAENASENLPRSAPAQRSRTVKSPLIFRSALLAVTLAAAEP